MNQVAAMDQFIADHRKARDRFTTVLAQAEASWTNPSPCSEWDARAVAEHVIGLHDDLLLRPSGIEPPHADDDPIARWAATVPAIDAAVGPSGRAHDDRASDVDVEALLPLLTGELLVHTWDLAKAIGIDPDLDGDLCEHTLATMKTNHDQMVASGGFASPVPVPSDADAATRMIAFTGRDPNWMP